MTPMPPANPSEPAPRRSPALTVALAAAVATAVFRVIPYAMRLPNCTPVGALGLFGGGRLRGWKGFALPIATMAVSDLGMYALYGWKPFNKWVYACFLVYPLLGRLLARRDSVVRIGLGAFLGALVFFLVTNFAVWTTGHAVPGVVYEPTFAGLINCYAYALPFFGYTLAGDLGFAAVLFGAHAWLARTAERPATVAEPAAGDGA
jgi:hypothetical protein